MGHFYSRAHDILASCKAYIEGVQVGVRYVDKGGRKSSNRFKADLLRYVKLLVQDFNKIGVKDCQKFMYFSKSDSSETDYFEADSFETEYYWRQKVIRLTT
jgi:ubiquitin-conjugating enzyme E2 O